MFVAVEVGNDKLDQYFGFQISTAYINPKEKSSKWVVGIITWVKQVFWMLAI